MNLWSAEGTKYAHGEYIVLKHADIQSENSVGNITPSHTLLPNLMNFSSQTPKNGTIAIVAPAVNSAFCFIARLRSRRSASETNFAKL